MAVEELVFYSFSIGDCFGFFVTGLSYGLVFAGICFLVGLCVSQCLKLINMAG